MATYYIYSSFSEYHASGVNFSVMSESDNDWAAKHEDYTFVREVELQEPSKESVAEAGVKSIDNNIADLQMQITQQKEKKSQLLSITHQEES